MSSHWVNVVIVLCAFFVFVILALILHLIKFLIFGAYDIIVDNFDDFITSIGDLFQKAKQRRRKMGASHDAADDSDGDADEEEFFDNSVENIDDYLDDFEKLNCFTKEQLKNYCREHGIAGYSGLNKEALIHLIMDYQTDKAKEEWIWVEGYKGTNKDMTCLGYQYEMGKVHEMPEDAEIKDCESGFHMCLGLKDVFDYYDIGNGHRFFKVKALVRKTDKEEYNGYDKWYIPSFYIDNSGQLRTKSSRNKLAAKAIEFISELSVDEIFADIDTEGWTEEHKRIAIDTNVETVRHTVKLEKLVELGYSNAFAEYLIENNKFNIANAVGSQTDLSMDMKVLMIMNG
jgi:hypothetical protein